MTQGLSGIKQDNGCESPFVNLENALFLFWGVFWEDWVLFFFLAVLGLRCRVQAFSSGGERGLLFVEALRLLTVVASLVVPGARPQRSWYTCLVAPRPVGFSWTRDQTHVPCIGR